MFHCKRYNGFKKDEFGLVSVKTWYQIKFRENPFIFSEQTQQCFYSIDPTEPTRTFVYEKIS